MPQAVAADYGFTKTSSGQETTLIVTESSAYKSIAKVRGLLWNGFIVFIALMIGLASNSFIAAIVAFVAIKYGFQFLGKVLGKTLKIKTTAGDIVIRPTTISVGERTYELKDVRDWFIGNSRDNRVVATGTQQLVQEIAAKTAWFIKFHYGAEQVSAAFNLSEPQANALLNEILATIQSKS